MNRCIRNPYVQWRGDHFYQFIQVEIYKKIECHLLNLMFNLRTEYGLKTNIEMITVFRELGVVVYDCAYCPLHRMETKSDQRHAATVCLKNYKRHFLHQNTCPIITFFPAKRGFLKSELPEISSRIVAEFRFSSLQGIREAISKCLGRVMFLQQENIRVQY